MRSNSNNDIQYPVADSLVAATSPTCLEPLLLCADSQHNGGRDAAALRTIEDCPLLVLCRSALHRLTNKLFGLFFLALARVLSLITVKPNANTELKRDRT